jgi:hypothetical protein
MHGTDHRSISLATLTPAQLFWSFALLHLVMWILVPMLASPNVPLDVIEGYAWGREWVIGTYKHPPMQAWCLEILTLLTNRAIWAHFLASQIAIVVAFWAVWQTGRRLTDEKTALLGALLLEGVVYYNFTSPEFNPNVLQLPFWALMCLSFHRAVKENRWFDWVLLGVWTAGGCYSKYSTVVIAGILGLLLLHPKARRRLRGIGPYFAVLTALLLLAPHLWWLVENNFLPFTYAKERAMLQGPDYYGAWQPLQFIAAQCLALAAAFVLFLVLAGGRIKYKDALGGASSFDRVFLNAITFGPVVVVLLIAVFSGMNLRDMWGACLWNFIGLWFLLSFKLLPLQAVTRRFAMTFCGVFVLGLVAHAGHHFFGPPWLHYGKRVHFPGRDLSEHVTSAWQERFHTPLLYVVGDTWLTGNVAYYMPVESLDMRPHIYIGGEFRRSPWIQMEAFKRAGSVLLWCGGNCDNEDYAKKIPPHLLQGFPTAEVQEPMKFTWQTRFRVKQAIIGWAFVLPAP